MTLVLPRKFSSLLLLTCGLLFSQAEAQTAPAQLRRSHRDSVPVRNRISAVYHVTWAKQLIDSRTTIIVSGAALLILDHGSLLSFNAATGHTEWTVGLVNFVRPSPLPFVPQVPSSPTGTPFTPILAAGGVVITGISSPEAGQLVALDEKTGSARWRYISAMAQPAALVPGISTLPQKASQAGSTSRGWLLGQPVLWKGAVIIRTNVGLTAVALSDGRELWNTPIDEVSLLPPIPSGRPAVSGQSLYLNSDFGIAYAFNARNGAKLWSTSTQGISSVHSSVYNRLSISVNSCDPLLADGRLFVADGNNNIYAIAADSGRTIWQARIGFTWRFCSVGGSLLACSAHGLFQIDPATGKILRQRLMPGGAWDCLVFQDRAVLIGNPYENPGWEIFDWKQWKTLWRDPSFAVTTGVLGDKGRVVLSGFDVASTPKDRKYSVRVYAPSN